MSTRHSARETEQLGFGQGVSKGNIVGKKQGYDVRPGCVLVCQLLGIQEGGTPAGDMHAPIMTLAWPAHLSHLDDLIPTLHSQVWWHHRLHTATNKWYVNCSPLL